MHHACLKAVSTAKGLGGFVHLYYGCIYSHTLYSGSCKIPYVAKLSRIIIFATLHTTQQSQRSDKYNKRLLLSLHFRNLLMLATEYPAKYIFIWRSLTVTVEL